MRHNRALPQMDTNPGCPFEAHCMFNEMVQRASGGHVGLASHLSMLSSQLVTVHRAAASPAFNPLTLLSHMSANYRTCLSVTCTCLSQSGSSVYAHVCSNRARAGGFFILLPKPYSAREYRHWPLLKRQQPILLITNIFLYIEDPDTEYS